MICSDYNHILQSDDLQYAHILAANNGILFTRWTIAVARLKENSTLNVSNSTPKLSLSLMSVSISVAQNQACRNLCVFR